MALSISSMIGLSGQPWSPPPFETLVVISLIIGGLFSLWP